MGRPGTPLRTPWPLKESFVARLSSHTPLSHSLPVSQSSHTHPPSADPGQLGKNKSGSHVCHWYFCPTYGTWKAFPKQVSS